MKAPILRSILGFVWTSRGIYFVSALLFLVILAGLSVAGVDMFTAGKFWTDYLDPFVGMAVLIVALALWFGEVRQDWRNSLPRRLSVVFRYRGDNGDREVMRCVRAGLASEADVRALAQQIGAQMVAGQLDFRAPNVKQSGGNVEVAEDGDVYRHHVVTLELRKLPSAIADLPKDHVLVWRPPFSEDPIPERRD
jgi:hypothetical protein